MTRAWKAAKEDRLSADWLSAGGDINQELRSQLAIIRRRARELEQNSNLARRYLQLCETHIVGPKGFTLDVQGRTSSGGLDTDNNKFVQGDFADWSRRGVCEVTGRYSLPACERIAVRSAARDGETLIRMHDVRPTLENPWGFVIELLDAARLDHNLNDDLQNGNRIRLGIELTKAGKPIAYWFLKGNQSSYSGRRDAHDRVPAEDIIHWFDPDRPEQLRGVSWMASGILTAHQIDQYQEAAIVAARAGASKMGWVKGGQNAHAIADEKDANGDLIEELEPGVIGHLGADGDFIGFDPKYPHEAYPSFMETNHRDLAAGWGVSYHALTGNLKDVNFSSIRTGTLEERERWMVTQDSFEGAVMRRIYLRWLNAAVFNGRFGLIKVSRETALQRFAAHKFQGRRWKWVDPAKDIKAIVEAINAGLASPQSVAAELGVDVNEILDQIAEFQKSLKEKVVTLPVFKNNTSPAGKDEGGQDDAATA
nr:phage portal protein [Gammaproteobacteria bacterium]